MRKLIILAAIIVIAMTAVVWSIAPVAGPWFAGKAEETSAPVSPHEIMRKQGKVLPVESWDAF
jgi:hypothetical protein